MLVVNLVLVAWRSLHRKVLDVSLMQAGDSVRQPTFLGRRLACGLGIFLWHAIYSGGQARLLKDPGRHCV